MYRGVTHYGTIMSVSFLKRLLLFGWHSRNTNNKEISSLKQKIKNSLIYFTNTYIILFVLFCNITTFVRQDIFFYSAWLVGTRYPSSFSSKPRVTSIQSWAAAMGRLSRETPCEGHWSTLVSSSASCKGSAWMIPTDNLFVISSSDELDSSWCR